MSPKHCPKCGEQGDCLESRQARNHVTRRYECGCGNRWSTTELYKTEVDGLQVVLKKYLKLQASLKDLT